MKTAVQRVVSALEAVGCHVEPIEFAQSTRTAEDAARALGVEVGQIVKSLVFVAGAEPVLVLVSGAHRASVAKLEARLAEPVRRADADTVRTVTGVAIGGVPPVGHPSQLRTLIDDNLLSYVLVYAAAGTPNTVFPIEPQSLVTATSGDVLDLTE